MSCEKMLTFWKGNIQKKQMETYHNSSFFIDELVKVVCQEIDTKTRRGQAKFCVICDPIATKYHVFDFDFFKLLNQDEEFFQEFIHAFTMVTGYRPVYQHLMDFKFILYFSLV